MEQQKSAILADLYRICLRTDGVSLRKEKFKNATFRHLFYYRKLKAAKNPIFRYYYTLKIKMARKKSGIELWKADIGEGALFIHPFGITLGDGIRAGKNLTMLKGSTIGKIKGGKKAGSPVLGNNVYIGLNSTVVGGINVGDDVLISANSFVNFNVPSHSIVIGSPGVIHQKEDATGDYIVNAVE